MKNREFKFRLYSFFDRSFHYFDIYDYPSGLYGSVSAPQQYTGLTDSNNKEIYEGDYLSITYENPYGIKTGLVIYSEDHGGYIIQGSGFSKNQNYIDLNCDSAFDAKIVGNVFETIVE